MSQSRACAGWLAGTRSAPSLFSRLDRVSTLDSTVVMNAISTSQLRRRARLTAIR